jgi:hypothetical protein
LVFGGYAGLALYRVYHGKHVHENVPPQSAANLNQPPILAFSKTNAFRDDEAIRASNAALAAICNKQLARFLHRERRLCLPAGSPGPTAFLQPPV